VRQPLCESRGHLENVANNDGDRDVRRGDMDVRGGDRDMSVVRGQTGSW
jgi:hypothetical protein